MANSEVFPSSLFPLRGDISAESGATTVLVQGIQTIPVTTAPPTDGAVLTFVEANADIEWGLGVNALSAVLCNGAGVSLDYLILSNVLFAINYDSDTFLGVRCNGILVGN